MIPMEAALIFAAKATPAVPAEIRLLVIVGSVVVVMIVVALVKASSSAAKKEESRRRSEANVAVAKAFWAEAEARGGLPPVLSPVGQNQPVGNGSKPATLSGGVEG